MHRRLVRWDWYYKQLKVGAAQASMFFNLHELSSVVPEQLKMDFLWFQLYGLELRGMGPGWG